MNKDDWCPAGLMDVFSSQSITMTMKGGCCTKTYKVSLEGFTHPVLEVNYDANCCGGPTGITLHKNSENYATITSYNMCFSNGEIGNEVCAPPGTSIGKIKTINEFCSPTTLIVVNRQQQELFKVSHGSGRGCCTTTIDYKIECITTGHDVVSIVRKPGSSIQIQFLKETLSYIEKILLFASVILMDMNEEAAESSS